MKHDWEFNSVASLMKMMLEAYPRSCELLSKRYGVPFDDDDEAKVLKSLDMARKAHDQYLSLLDHEVKSYSPSQAHDERVVLNSLRKWQSKVMSRVEDAEDPAGSRLTDVTRTLARDRKRTAVDGFIERNRIAGERSTREPVFLLGEMATIVRHMLRGFTEIYDSTEPKFGTGAVYERIPMLARWERLRGISRTGLDLYWDMATCHTKARLCAVAKQWDKDRLITVEPFASTWLQHKARLALGTTLVNNGFGHIVDQGLSGHDGPQYHRRRALEASAYLGDFSTWATLDLTDASDCITQDQVSWIFPPEVTAVLDRARSQSVEFKDAEGRSCEVPLHIYGGMGNATTFMVESIVFYALVQASCRLRGCTARLRDVSIVGDDLLIRGLDQTEAAIWGLKSLGYKLSEAKSFFGLNVPVRESCGCWGFNGSDIYVPAYLGYSKAGSQMLALADYIRQAPCCLEDSFLSRLGEWVNTPVKVANTVSVCDPMRTVSYDRIRWNRRTCQLEVQALTAETKLWYAPADYECSPGGALAILTRQVTTAPVTQTYAPAFQKKVRASWAVAARSHLRTTRPRVIHIDPKGRAHIHAVFTDEHEDALDLWMADYHPDRWAVTMVAIADPYSTKLVHRWVPCVEHTVPAWDPPWGSRSRLINENVGIPAARRRK